MEHSSLLASWAPLGFCMSVVGILTIVSILASGFILSVNIRDWLKGRTLSPVDRLLVAFSLSTTGLSFIYGTYIFFLFLWPQLFSVHYAFTIVFAVMIGLTFSNSWLTAWLCLYFFIKIINSRSPFFAKMKLTIDMAVPWLIVFSEVVAFSSSLPLIWSFIRTVPYNATSCNPSCPVVPFQINNMYYAFVFGFSVNSAFLVVLVSTVCIVWSLCRHTYHMKKTLSSEEHSRLRTHRKAAQTVTSLLLIYIVFYVTCILMTSVFSSNDANIYYWLTVWVSQSTSPAMSLTLILGNAKLCQEFHKTFCCSSPSD